MTCLHTQSDQPHLPALDTLVQSEVDAHHIGGGVLLVTHGDKIVHKRAYGYAQEFDYDLNKMDPPVMMSVDDMFDLASLTKVFSTTFGIMMLVDEGKIGLDDPVHEYLPEFTGPEKDKITIRNLLTHSSGLYQWQPLYYHASNDSETYRYICSLPLEYPVGAGRHYSDLGFMMLGYLIQKVSGMPLDQFMNSRLYKPLALQHISFNPKQHGFDHFAATSHGNPFEKHMVYDDHFGYVCNEDPDSWNGWRHYTLVGEVNDGNSYYANNGVAGHAGLFSTVDDLHVLLNLMLSHGVFHGDTLIDPSVIQQFLTKDQYDNGLGWALDPDVIMAHGAPEGAFGHTGFTGTNVVVMPAQKVIIIFLTNRQNVGPMPSGYYYNLNDTRQKIVNIVLKYIQGAQKKSN